MNNTPDIIDCNDARKRFSRIGIAVAIMTAASIGAQYLLSWLVKSFAPELVTAEWFRWAISLAPIYLVGVPMFLLVTFKMPACAPQKEKLGVGHWFILLLICFPLMYAGNYIGNFLMTFINSVTGREATNAISDMLMGSSVILNLIFVVLIAPVVEEFVFRKCIIDRTRAYGERTAILLSALIFGLFHGNLYQFFYAFGIGLVFAYVYIRTGKLICSILLHMAINLFGGVVAPWIMSLIDMELIEKMTDPSFTSSLNTEEAMRAFIAEISPSLPGFMLLGLYGMIIFGASIAGFVLLLIRRKKIVFKQTELELPREYVGGVVYLNAGMIIMMAIGAVLIALSL